MDLAYLFNILLRRKWLLLSVVALSAITTWFLVGQLPPAFKASSVISTGIINYKGPNLQRDNPFIQKFQIESSFGGLVEKMKSRSTIKKLSDRLLMHDLLADGVTEKAFRAPEEGDMELTKSDLEDVVMKLKTNNSDTAVNEKPQIESPNTRVAEAYRYDYESLTEKLNIKRIGETDYLTVEFESESPELSYFVVNTFLEEFFRLYEDDLTYEERTAVEFYEKQVVRRKAELDSVVHAINIYKNANGLVDVGTQRESVVGQQKELEIKLEETRQQIPALQKNIAFLERQISDYNRVNGDMLTNKILFSDDITNLDVEIKKLVVQRIDLISAGTRNTAAIDTQIEGLKARQKRVLERSLAALPEEERDRIDDRLRQLVTEHLEKKLDYEFAIEAKQSYEREIGKLTGRAGKLLTDDNYLNTLGAEQERLQKEYLKASEEFDGAKLHSEGTENPLTLVEPAEFPVEPEPSHRVVFASFAGVAGGTLTSILLFLLAFVDTSIRTPSQFQSVTGLKLLGYLNKVNNKGLDFQNLFGYAQQKPGLEAFKENIRKLRTTLEGSGAKSFLVASPKTGEGCSFLIASLAYSLSLNNKRVLIIDTNFKHNTLSQLKGKPIWPLSPEGKNADLASQEGEDLHLKNIDILPNKGGSQSPSEVLAGKNFQQVVENYSKKYDFIFLEAAAMNQFSDARELLPFVEKMIVVFSSEQPIGSHDKDTLGYLRNLEGKMLGGVLNMVDLKSI